MQYFVFKKIESKISAFEKIKWTLKSFTCITAFDTSFQINCWISTFWYFSICRSMCMWPLELSEGFLSKNFWKILRCYSTVKRFNLTRHFFIFTQIVKRLCSVRRVMKFDGCDATNGKVSMILLFKSTCSIPIPLVPPAHVCILWPLSNRLWVKFFRAKWLMRIF